MQVGSGAVAICARPNAVSLAASHFEGPGLSRCIAGERAEFIIQVCARACPTPSDSHQRQRPVSQEYGQVNDLG